MMLDAARDEVKAATGQEVLRDGIWAHPFPVIVCSGGIEGRLREALGAVVAGHHVHEIAEDLAV